MKLLGSYRNSVPIYGSGGFTSYSDNELEDQLGGWVADNGCAFVKMKIGSHPERRPAASRTAKARDRRRTNCSSMPMAPTPSSRH